MRLIFFLLMTECAISSLAGRAETDLNAGFFLRKARDVSVDPYSRLAYYDSALTLLPANFRLIDLYKEKVALCNFIHRPDLGADTWDCALLRIKVENASQRCRLLAESALADRRAYRHRAMMGKVFDVLAIEKEDSLRPYNVYAWLDLAGMFHDFDNKERSSYYIKKALEEYEAIKDSRLNERDRIRMSTHLIMARVNRYIWNKKYSNAEAELRKLEGMHLSDQMEGGVLFTRALIYNLLGEHSKTDAIYQRLIDEFDTDSRDVGANNYLEQLISTGRTNDARELINRHKDVFRRLKKSPFAPSVYKNLVKLSKLEGDMVNALDYSDSLLNVADSLSSVRSAVYGSGLVDQIEDIERIRRAEKSVEERGRMLWWVSVLGMLAFLIALTAGFLWLRLKRRIRRNKILETQLDKIGDHHRQEMKDTCQNLESRTRELTSTTMRLASISAGIDRIRQLASDNSMSREEMAKLITDEFKRMQLSEGVWEMFRYYFDNINTGFYDKLYQRCPNLTNAERRMCAFIVMNLTNKEIASLTNRSVRTVECIKYNLKRKLAIDIPTEEFLLLLNKDECR